jgi:hypothetical protein
MQVVAWEGVELQEVEQDDRVLPKGGRERDHHDLLWVPEVVTVGRVGEREVECEG